MAKSGGVGRIKYKFNIGDRFNKLVVIGEKFKKERNYYIKCKCDCGIEKDISCWSLYNNFTSCCQCIKSDKPAINYKGHKDLSGLYLATIKIGAKKRELDYSLTVEYLWELFEKQNFKCNLSGLDIQLTRNRKVGEQTASLDRIDNNIGYIEGNVQWIHKNINLMKNHFDQNYFVDMCKLIANKFNGV